MSEYAKLPTQCFFAWFSMQLHQCKIGFQHGELAPLTFRLTSVKLCLQHVYYQPVTWTISFVPSCSLSCMEVADKQKHIL